MILLVKYPTRSRPTLFLKTLSEFIDMSYHRTSTHYLVSFDIDDASMTPEVVEKAKSLDKNVIMVAGRSANKVDACNRDVEKITGTKPESAQTAKSESAKPNTPPNDNPSQTSKPSQTEKPSQTANPESAQTSKPSQTSKSSQTAKSESAQTSKSESAQTEAESPLNWDIILLLSDDMEVASKGWDDRVRKDMARCFPDTDGCLWYYDGFQTKRCTLSCMGRKYYDRFGYLYHPSYRSLFCDDEFTEVAKREGKIVFIQVPIALHQNPYWGGKVPMDALYRRNGVGIGEANWKEDEENFKRRRDAGWPRA